MSQLPLARTYRPQRFSEVLGQQVPSKALGAAAKTGTLASSYIFSGTRGIGKTTIARIFAKTLNCAEGPAEDCCDQCQACIEIREGRCLDVLEVDAATHTGIDDIRELREAAQYPPGQERYRVFILDEAHQLSAAAWNGLLKVLEEPPQWCVFLFCTTEPHKIPATIESRSLHFAFRSPSPAQLKGHLQRVAQDEALEIDSDALDLLVKAADGSVRDGLSAMDQVRALVGQSVDAGSVRDALGLVPGEAIARYVEALTAGDTPAALEVVASMEESGQDLRSVAAEALEAVRRLALDLTLGGKADSGPFPEQLVYLGKVLDETETRLRQGGPQRTLLDLATIRMTRMAGLEKLEELVGRLEEISAGPRSPMGGNPSGRGPGGRGLGSEGPGGRGPGRGGPGGRGPGSGRPAGGPQRSAPASKPSTAGPPASRTDPDRVAHSGASARTGNDLADLSSQMQDSSPALAAVLRQAKSTHCDDSGRLRITLSQDAGEFVQARLSSDEGKQSLAGAWAALGYPKPRQVEILREASEAKTPSHKALSREEILEEARKDPAVRSLFERFGAVVLQSKSIEPEAGG